MSKTTLRILIPWTLNSLAIIHDDEPCTGVEMNSIRSSNHVASMRQCDQSEALSWEVIPNSFKDNPSKLLSWGHLQVTPSTPRSEPSYLGCPQVTPMSSRGNQSPRGNQSIQEMMSQSLGDWEKLKNCCAIKMSVRIGASGFMYDGLTEWLIFS